MKPIDIYAYFSVPVGWGGGGGVVEEKTNFGFLAELTQHKQNLLMSFDKSQKMSKLSQFSINYNPILKQAFIVFFNLNRFIPP